MADETISFEDATSVAAPKQSAPDDLETINFEDAVPQDEEISFEDSESEGFLTRSLDATKGLKAVVTAPKDFAKGALKAVTNMTVGMGELAFQGLSGLAGLMSDKRVSGRGYKQVQASDPQAGDFFSAFEGAKAQTEKMREYAGEITKINLAPDNKEQEAVGNFLAILPDAVTAAGDTVYDKTGSALAGAGTQALLTLLTFKPGIVGKVLSPLRRAESPAAAAAKARIEPVMNELAATNPDAVTKMAEHVKEADPELAKTLLGKIDEMKDLSPEQLTELGEKSAQAKSSTPPEMQLVGFDEATGKPRVRMQEAISDDMAKAVQEAGQEIVPKPEAEVPLKIEAELKPGEVTPEAKPLEMEDVPPVIHQAFSFADAEAVDIIRGKMKVYADQAIRNIVPEAMGKEAEAAGGLIAKNIAIQMQRDSRFTHQAATRRGFFDKQKPEELNEFLERYEKGDAQATPALQIAADGYKQWNADIAKQDVSKGIKYDVEDNYMYHTFDRGKELISMMEQKHGVKWGDPGFTKDRVFKLYQQAIDAGYKPKFSNPEEIMLARQHASDVAAMKVDVLNDLESAGLATKAKESPWEGGTQRRSPNGEMYWVHPKAAQIIHNAFDSKSLWNMEGIIGDTFRGAMWLKNTMVPVQLAFSGFHALHVLTIDNATAMKRASAVMLSGAMNPVKWFAKVVADGLYAGDSYIPLKGIVSHKVKVAGGQTGGTRMLNVWKGLVKDSELTQADRVALQYMTDGGFIPEMSSQYKTSAVENLQKAIRKRSLTAVYKLPLAVIALTQKPMFEHWIPSLKISSYLKDVNVALKLNPQLMNDPVARSVAFRKLSKSIDNRYGEMAYGTLFWNKWIKDIGVANTLSLGWQLGFLREHGGGFLDIGKALTTKGGVSAKAKSGLLDRPLFVTFYTTQSLMYGGLMNYMMSGQVPEEPMDYVYPRIGTNEDGSPKRVGTMFFVKEFMSIAKHIEHEGVVSGMGHLASNKASGVIGLVGQTLTGINDFGEEVRNPDSDAFAQLEQQVNATMKDFQPISVEAIRKGEDPVLSTLGFSPAPKYVLMSTTEAHVRQAFKKYVSAQLTPFDKAQMSDDRRELKQALKAGDDKKYDEVYDKMVEKYELTPKDIRRLEKSLNSDEDPVYKMFQRLTWQKQKVLLDKMTPDEREAYLPYSNKDHLKFKYEPPGE